MVVCGVLLVMINDKEKPVIGSYSVGLFALSIMFVFLWKDMFFDEKTFNLSLYRNSEFETMMISNLMTQGCFFLINLLLIPVFVFKELSFHFLF